MRNMFGHVAVAASGLLSFTLTVVAVLLIERITAFNLFTLSFWLVLPVGAVLTGAAAAAGYYYASLFFHTRPTWFTLVQVIAVASLAMLAIYFAEYVTLTIDGFNVASVLSFPEYIHLYLTTMEMTVGRGQTNTGEVGEFGYFLAALQFLGFIIGGVFVWIMLRSHPVCIKCGRYVRNLVTRKQQFSTQEEFTQAYDSLFTHPVDTPGFGEWLRWSPRPAGQPAAIGAIQTTSTLRGCPFCGDQQVHQIVSVTNRKGEWEDVPAFTRSVSIPEGIDLRPAFRHSGQPS